MTFPTYRPFFTFGLLLFTAGLPAYSQIVAGTRTPISIPQPRDAAAENAAFHAQLREALSFRNISAWVARSSEIATKLPTDISLTTFDSVAAPCFFDQTTQLEGVFENAYFQGFHGNGGAVLNECANFTVNAFSSPNFLAFNKDVVFGTGRAILPELIVVGPSKTTVSLEVSAGVPVGDHIAVVALSQGGIQDTVEVKLTNDWQQVTVSGTAIQSVVVVGVPSYLLIDNVSAQ